MSFHFPDKESSIRHTIVIVKNTTIVIFPVYFIMTILTLITSSKRENFIIYDAQISCEVNIHPI
jgi:hypothetical protein